MAERRRGGGDRVKAGTDFYRKLADAYPAGFWHDFERLKVGDATGAESAISFIEADPWFFESGYVKARLATYLKRIPLSTPQRERLHDALIRIAASRYRQEYPYFCRLARSLATPHFATRLAELAASSDADVARRAKWMLAQVEEALRLRRER